MNVAKPSDSSPLRSAASSTRAATSPQVDESPAKPFAWVLCEELDEIRELRKKRQWDPSKGDTSRDPAAAVPPCVLPTAASVGPPVERCAERNPTAPETYADDVIKNAHAEGLVGLAFSGGGIRSATFNLGVLQGFANRGYLPMFDYLSTVSGGGYIGSWLETWILRANDPKESVCSNLPVGATPIRKVQECLRTDRVEKTEHQEPRPIRFLREYSNYLTPRLGLLGADTWTAVAIYLRNVFLNQLILILFLLAGLLLPYLAVWASSAASGAHLCWSYAPYIAPGAILILLGCSIVIVARNMKYLEGVGKGPNRKFKWYAEQGWILWMVVLPLVLAAWISSVWLDFSQALNGWTPWRWTITGLAAFGAVWLIGEVFNLPELGKMKSQWNSVPLAIASFISSLISGAAGGWLVWVLTKHIFAHWLASPARVWNIVGFGTPLVILIFLVVGALQIGLTGVYFPDPRREWWGRLGAFLMVISIGWAAAFALAAYSPLGLVWLRGYAAKTLTVGWIVSTLTGVLGGKSGSTGAPGSRSWKDIALSVTPYVFIVGLVSMLALGLELSLTVLNETCERFVAVFLKGSPVAEKVGGWIISFDYMIRGHAQGLVLPNSSLTPPATYIGAHWDILNCSLNLKLVAVFGVLAAVCWILAWRVNLNEFSMNYFYRNRLVRAYLGASHTGRKPNPFTGFDPHDDLPLKEMRHDRCYTGPFPIVNTTLNVVSGKDLAWQERKGESFVMTPLRCGFDVWLEQIDLKTGAPMAPPENIDMYGYRPTENFLYENGGPKVGAAVSISGAAASPNMGYHSVPSLAFLMTFFNVRLGYWAGNPRNKDTWTRPGPQVGLVRLLAELFGQTDDEAPYIYLSDGGHFENLGVYELVKRRCKFIVACDAGEDADYALGDLGNAIRKCREDMGIEILLSTPNLTPDKDTNLTKWHCAIGEIRYDYVDRETEPGVFVYLKSSLTGDETTDILNYHREHPEFPHETTADQWFSESQFEAYRRLGQHVVEWLLKPVEKEPVGDAKVPPLGTDDLFKKLQDHWKVKPLPDPADDSLLSKIKKVFC
jgi:hypothetical protein